MGSARLLPPADLIEARGLVHDRLGDPVPVTQRDDERTMLAITLDPAPLFRATGSGTDNVVAGGRLCATRVREFSVPAVVREPLTGAR